MKTGYDDGATVPKLNDTQCRTAKAKERPYKLADGNGLYLEVKPSAAKTWRYRFELGGKEGVYTIGDYPRVGLSDARKEREHARDLVRQGINPVHDRQADKVRRESENAVTFEAVAREWVGSRDWQNNTKARRLDTLTRVVFPTIGKLPVRAITSAHVLDILKRAASQNGPSVAHEVKRSISGVFELAIATLRADADPAYPVRKAIPANKTQHKRPLSLDEVGQLLRDLAGYQPNYQTVTAFRLMWMTLCRPSEAIEAEWQEFDLEAGVWTIPAGRTKKRAEHVVSLPRQAVDALRAIRGITGAGRFVFPNRDDRSKPMTTAALRQALKTLGWAGKYSPHATRTTGSTHLNEMGYHPDWVERQLAHIEQNAVRRTYNHAKHSEDRAKMMQAWADMLDALRDGAKVIPGNFRRVA